MKNTGTVIGKKILREKIVFLRSLLVSDFGKKVAGRFALLQQLQENVTGSAVEITG